MEGCVEEGVEEGVLLPPTYLLSRICYPLPLPFPPSPLTVLPTAPYGMHPTSYLVVPIY